MVDFSKHLKNPLKKISDLHGKNIVVFDLEIKNTIGDNGVSWTTYDKMGISVGCLFDYKTGENMVYCDDNIELMAQRIEEADLVVGFNIIGFDNNLLFANFKGIVIPPCYDLLKEVRRSTGKQLPKGCNLNEVLSATFGMQKTEDGAQAPIMYQEGRMGELISYCLADVRRERMCFEQAYVHGFLKTATHGIHDMECPLKRIGG